MFIWIRNCCVNVGGEGERGGGEGERKGGGERGREGGGSKQCIGIKGILNRRGFRSNEEWKKAIDNKEISGLHSMQWLEFRYHRQVPK